MDGPTGKAHGQVKRGMYVNFLTYSVEMPRDLTYRNAEIRCDCAALFSGQQPINHFTLSRR